MEDTFTEVEIGKHERLSLTIWQRSWSAVYGARWGLTRGWNLLSFLVLPRSLKPENIIECPENKPKTLIHLPSDQLVFRNNYHLVKSTLPVSCSWQNVRNILSLLLLLRYLKPWINRECPENKLQTLIHLSSDQKVSKITTTPWNQRCRQLFTAKRSQFFYPFWLSCIT